MRDSSITTKKIKKRQLHYKILAIGYLLFVLFSQATSPTNAVFNDTEEIHFELPTVTVEEEKRQKETEETEQIIQPEENQTKQSMTASQ